jgi:UDP-glucose 4-epimerase
MNMHISILRLSSVYGPRDFGRVIPLWIEQTVAGQQIEVYGGKQVIDVVWIQQVVEAMVRVAGLDRPLPATNIASGTGTRVVDLARRIGRLTSSQTHIRLQPARPMDVTRFVANVDRMRQLLDLDPPLDPLANLSDMIAAPVGV